MCRRAYGEIRLHRPLGDQLRLFVQHLPGQRTRVAGYDDTLTPEQVAAMMPTATHAVGLAARASTSATRSSGSRQPVRFNLQRGLRQRSQHDDPQRRRARLGQDDARSEAQVRGLPAGRAGDRLRPEGRPPLPPARGGRAAHRVRHAAPGSGAARRCSTRCGSRPSTCARTPRSRSCAICCRRAPSRLGDRGRRRRRPGAAARSREPTCLRGRARAARRATRPTRRSARRSTVYARSGLTQLGFADPAVKLPPVGQQPGDLPADPRPAGAAAGDARARSTRRPSASASRSCG